MKQALCKGRYIFPHGDLHTRNFIWDGEKLTLIDFGRSYSIDLHQNIRRETFQPTSEHVRSLCTEPPYSSFVGDLHSDWERYSTVKHEYKDLALCLHHVIGRNLYKEVGPDLNKFRQVVQDL